MFLTLSNALWTARRVYQQQRRIRHMLDPRTYERHGRSRWIPDETQARRVERAATMTGLFLIAAFVVASVAWLLGVI